MGLHNNKQKMSYFILKVSKVVFGSIALVTVFVIVTVQFVNLTSFSLTKF